MHSTKLALGLPWYMGPDVCCFAQYFEFIGYLNKLRERTLWRAAMGTEAFNAVVSKLPPLGGQSMWAGDCEPTDADYDRMGILELYLVDHSRCSLPGRAREDVIDTCKQVRADHVLFWDADMKFHLDTFLRLWRHNKPAVAALAFTARYPTHPVIYRLVEGFDEKAQKPFKGWEVVLKYPKDKLIGNADVDGAISFGTGVCLIDMDVFEKIPKPWFNSTGCGEDAFFCMRLHEHGIPRHIDTSVKAWHKIHTERWACEEDYDKDFEQWLPAYRELFPHCFREGQ